MTSHIRTVYILFVFTCLSASFSIDDVEWDEDLDAIPFRLYHNRTRQGFLDPDRRDVLAKLKGKHILMVGDHLMRNHYLNLAYFLTTGHWRSPTPHNERYQDYGTAQDFFAITSQRLSPHEKVCDCTRPPEDLMVEASRYKLNATRYRQARYFHDEANDVRLTYIEQLGDHNVTLKYNVTGVSSSRSFQGPDLWVHLVCSYHPSVIVVNQGMWQTYDNPSRISQIRKAVLEGKRCHQPTRWIWKTSTPDGGFHRLMDRQIVQARLGDIEMFDAAVMWGRFNHIFDTHRYYREYRSFIYSELNKALIDVITTTTTSSSSTLPGRVLQPKCPVNELDGSHGASGSFLALALFLALLVFRKLSFSSRTLVGVLTFLVLCLMGIFCLTLWSTENETDSSTANKSCQKVSARPDEDDHDELSDDSFVTWVPTAELPVVVRYQGKRVTVNRTALLSMWKGKHILMIGDSTMRYQYLNLALFFTSGYWRMPTLSHELVYERVGRAWAETYEFSNRVLRYEKCDCFRLERGDFYDFPPYYEARYYRHPEHQVNITYLRQFVSYPVMLHFDNHTCRPGYCSDPNNSYPPRTNRDLWLQQTLKHCPDVVVLNQGIWGSYDNQSTVTDLLWFKAAATEGCSRRNNGRIPRFIWKTTYPLQGPDVFEIGRIIPDRYLVNALRGTGWEVFDAALLIHKAAKYSLPGQGQVYNGIHLIAFMNVGVNIGFLGVLHGNGALRISHD